MTRAVHTYRNSLSYCWLNSLSYCWLNNLSYLQVVEQPFILLVVLSLCAQQSIQQRKTRMYRAGIHVHYRQQYIRTYEAFRIIELLLLLGSFSLFMRFSCIVRAFLFAVFFVGSCFFVAWVARGWLVRWVVCILLDICCLIRQAVWPKQGCIDAYIRKMPCQTLKYARGYFRLGIIPGTRVLYLVCLV